MRDFIDRLLQGDEDVPAAFVKAKAFWDEFHRDHRDDQIEALAEALSDAQTRFELLLGHNRGLAKEIMALTAVASLYDTGAGMEDNSKYAVRVIKGFTKSFVSSEVKSGARRAAKLYSLTDYDTELSKMLKDSW